MTWQVIKCIMKCIYMYKLLTLLWYALLTLNARNGIAINQW